MVDHELSCPKCGASVLRTDTQCMDCGASLTAAPQQQTQAAPQTKAAPKTQAAPHAQPAPGASAGRAAVLGRVFGTQQSGDHVQVIVTSTGVHAADVMTNAPGIVHLAGFGVALLGAMIGGGVGLLLTGIILALVGAATGGLLILVVWGVPLATAGGGFYVGWSFMSAIARLFVRKYTPAQLKGVKGVSLGSVENQLSVGEEAGTRFLDFPGYEGIKLSAGGVKELNDLLKRALRDPTFQLPTK